MIVKKTLGLILFISLFTGLFGQSNVEKVMKKVDKNSPEYIALSFLIATNKGDEKQIKSYIHSLKIFNIYHGTMKEYLSEKKDRYDFKKEFKYSLMKVKGNSQRIRIQVREKKTNDLVNKYITVYKIKDKWWVFVPSKLVKKE